MKVTINGNRVSINDDGELQSTWLEGFDQLKLFFDNRPSRTFNAIDDDTSNRLVVFTNVDALELE